jgi:hypothetical protein
MLVKDIFHALRFQLGTPSVFGKKSAGRIPMSEKRRRLPQYSTIARAAAGSPAAD